MKEPPITETRRVTIQPTTDLLQVLIFEQKMTNTLLVRLLPPEGADTNVPDGSVPTIFFVFGGLFLLFGFMGTNPLVALCGFALLTVGYLSNISTCLQRIIRSPVFSRVH